MAKENISFNVIIVPEGKYVSEESDLKNIETFRENVKDHLQKSGLENFTINLSKFKTSDDDASPEIEEISFEIEILKSNLNRSKFDNRDWMQLWKSFASQERYFSMLSFSDNYFFKRSRQTLHRVNSLSFSFGVLPFNKEFHEHALFQHAFGGLISFHHDTRSIDIKITNQNYEIKTTYQNIRNIFINIDFQCEIFLDLVNPPLIYTNIKRNNNHGSYQIDKRILTIPSLNVDILGRSNILKIVLADERSRDEIISNIHFKTGEKPIYYAPIYTKSKSKPLDISIDLNHFGSTYMLTAMIRRNFVLLSQLDWKIEEFLREMKSYAMEDGDALEKALVLVLASLDSDRVINYYHSIQKYFKYYTLHNEELNFKHYLVPEKCRMIRRVTSTPTRLLMWAPEIMFGNRVLRNYDSEFAIRISFRDDNNLRMSIGEQFADANIFQYAIKEPLTSGIFIGKRKYEFLAWSNSQIREHGVWMYARDDEGQSVRDIRVWMGDFSHIHTVPKYMARMGQCFSQTEDAVSVPLNSENVRTEDDIERGTYCFSDGIGRISIQLANQVKEALGHDKLCSAFQIRYGGYKGMLVVDPTLRDTHIVFRKSMKKFDSPKNIRLEIAKTSAPGHLQLNRPLITILTDLGVRHRTFLKLQEEILNDLTHMLFDEEKAAEFLESMSPFQLFSFKQMSQSGIHLTTEPFFRAQLLALHRHNIGKIKSHANVPIDPNLGRNMFGVLDETGKLNYGQVFVQYTKDIIRGETTKDTRILEGIVMVTKNPCMYPGDVRKFNAVDIPELHHIVDCIVFPQKGPRPHPNEMAGSDLDGDEYSVIWDTDLIFHRPNCEPGHFPSTKSEEIFNIKDSHMIDFLAKYIQNDQVGVIGHSHLAWADYGTVFSQKCLGLAKKYSYSVDFAKTGVSQKIERLERPKHFPDFMEKSHKESYKSKKALGKMYRVVRDYESENEGASTTYRDVQLDTALVYPGWEKYKENAVAARNKFNSLLKTVLRNYGVQHEAEVFSGAFTKLHCRFRERKDRAEIEKVIVKSIMRLSKSMHEEFLEEFKLVENANVLTENIKRKASAWYVVTYSDKNSKFLSFPWCVSAFLSNIKMLKFQKCPLYASPIVKKMDEQIKICALRDSLPHYDYQSIRIRYKFQCEPSIVHQALGVLIHWAQENQVVEKPHHDVRGLIFLPVFVKLFLFVAEKAGYVQHVDDTNHILPQKPSAAALCLEFLRFCLTLRFYTKDEIANIIPFQVYKYSALSKIAVVAYHRFAVQGQFASLYQDECWDEEIIEMNEIAINSKIFRTLPIRPESLRKAEDALVKHSRVEEVNLREITQTKKVIVSALGSEPALKALKRLLRKKESFLTHLFLTGNLPLD